MSNYDIVIKIIGHIMPIGETNEDNRRFENLKSTCDLVNLLIEDIDRVAHISHRQEFSIKRAEEFAHKFLNDLGIEDNPTHPS